MSGEGAGVIIGGVVLLGAIPVVIAGAAVAAAAAGVIAVGKAAVEGGMLLYQRRKLAVEGCSAELSAFYGRVQGAIDAQNRFSREYYEKMRRQMDEMAAGMQEAARNCEDGLEERLREAKAAQRQAIGEARRTELERIRKETEAETGAALKVLQEAQRTKLELLDWQSASAAAKAGQEALARDLLRDAAATVRLLESIGTSDQAFQQRAASMRRIYQDAARALEQGGFQTAAAGAQQVVSRGAGLALEYEARQQERDAVRIALEAQLEGLLAELDAHAALEFHDELYGKIEESMDDFTQGEFGKVRRRVQELLDELRSEEGQSYSAGKMQIMLEDAENELAGRVAGVLKTGRDMVLQYYQRLHALETVSEYMEEQGYTAEWIQPAGGDVTQKLVINFREPRSGNTIALSLDGEAGAEEIGRMAMEVMFYYANGRPVTEEEKAAIRQGVLDALKEKGVGGELHCTGSVGQEAADKRLGSQEAVQNLPRKPITLENA